MRKQSWGCVYALVVVLLGLLAPATAGAQGLGPEDVARIAQTVHDAERVDLGAGSSRDYRNAFWERVIGIVHYGHPVYNDRPDPRWHIKDAGNGRPQSDDVAVIMPGRHYWDCIPGAGAAGYSFRCSYDGVLSAEQNVYKPRVPDGGGAAGGPPANPGTPAGGGPPAVDVGAIVAALERLGAKLDQLIAVTTTAADGAGADGAALARLEAEAAGTRAAVESLVLEARAARIGLEGLIPLVAAVRSELANGVRIKIR
jgi:hypothetical protein